MTNDDFRQYYRGPAFAKSALLARKLHQTLHFFRRDKRGAFVICPIDPECFNHHFSMSASDFAKADPHPLVSEGGQLLLMEDSNFGDSSRYMW
jgi:hypothetical protein